MPGKIVLRVFGGLGNQLFAYAAARRLAKISGSELVIDDVSGFVRDHVYGRHYQLDNFRITGRKAAARERLEPGARVRRYLLRKINRLLPFERRCYLQQEGMDFDRRMLAIRPQGTLHLEGYWQGEGYFKDIEAIVRQEFEVVPPSDAQNSRLSAEIHACTSVAVHVRFFDLPGEQGVTNAPGDYYAKAVARMDELVPGANYFIFSDQPDAARSRIPLPDDRVTCVSHNRGDEMAYADLWLMTQCQHFIIANSTFSWWGAWLSTSPEKQVIAPGYRKLEGKAWWGFDGLLPPEWIKL